MNKYPEKMNKKLGIINPNKVPSKVLFGLIEGYINLFPKTFPEIKAKISVNTEISNAVKKSFYQMNSLLDGLKID